MSSEIEGGAQIGPVKPYLKFTKRAALKPQDAPVCKTIVLSRERWLRDDVVYEYHRWGPDYSTLKRREPTK